MLFSLLPVFPHLNSWPLSLLLTFEVLWKHRPHLYLHPAIYGSERRPDACCGICRVGAGVLTARRLKESQQAGGRRRRDGCLSQPCWQRAPRLKGNILFNSQQPFADWFWLRWRAQWQCEIKALLLLFEFHRYFSFQTASSDGQDFCWNDDHKPKNWSGASVFVLLLTSLKCTASKPAARSVFSAVESILLSCSSRRLAAANLMLLSTPCCYFM